MKKKTITPLFIALLTMIMLIVPQFTITAEETTTSQPDTTTTTTAETQAPPAGAPSYSIFDQQVFPVTAGEDTSFRLQIENISTADAAKTTASILDDKNIVTILPGSITRANYIKAYSTMYVNVLVNVPKTTPSGKRPLTIKLNNTNRDGATSEQTLTFYIDVKNDVKFNGVNVLEYSTDKSPVKAGDNFNLTVKLQNSCGIDVPNVNVLLDGLDGTKFAMNGAVSSKKISLKKDEIVTLTFPLIACDGITSIREVLPLKLSYQIDPANKETLQESTTNTNVACTVIKKGDDADKTFAPNIIIDNYSFGGAYVVGGKTFPLALTIRNTSATSSIKNLKVTIQGVAGKDDAGVAFSPANSSNTFFYENFGVNAAEKINIDFLPKADAKPNSYPIQVTFDYEYTANGKTEKAETVTQTITVPLQQDDRFSVNPPEIEANSTIGQECPLSVTVVNKGKSAVYNVSVDVEGEGFDKTSSAYYIGNVESGKEELYDAKIIPNKEGEIKGTIVVTYEDSNGTQKEIREEFVTTAMHMIMDNGGGKDGINDMPVDANVDGAAKKSPIPLLIGIGIGVVVVVAGTIVTVKVLKKKKQKALEKEDNDEDI